MLLLSFDHLYVFQSRWWQLNSVLCNHRFTTLIWDPAYDQIELDIISEQANKLESNSNYLIYTHGDYDHIPGGPDFKEFKQVGSVAFEERKDKNRVVEQIENLDHEFYVKRNAQVTFPTLDIKIATATPGILKLGNLEAHFYRAGGHTPDGLFTIIPELGLWVAGDYLSDIEFPFVEDKLEDYFETLAAARQIMKDYELKVMVPGHGNPAFTREEVLSRIDSSERYLNSLTLANIPDWKTSWGNSPFHLFLDKMHQKNIRHARSQIV